MINRTHNSLCTGLGFKVFISLTEPLSSDICGWIQNVPDVGVNVLEECGEQCHHNPFTALTFYCEKGEKCCPIGPFGEMCSETCGPYDVNGL